MKQQELDENYQAHLRRKTEVRKLKSEAKKRSMLTRSISSLLTYKPFYNYHVLTPVPCTINAKLWFTTRPFIMEAMVVGPVLFGQRWRVEGEPVKLNPF